jgi:hypothetical protein
MFKAAILIASYFCAAAPALNSVQEGSRDKQDDAVKVLLSRNTTDAIVQRELSLNANTITDINLSRPELSAAGWKLLSDFKRTRKLNIALSDKLVDENLIFPRRFNELRSLTLFNCDKIDGHFLARSDHWQALNQFFIKGRSFDGQHLLSLKGSSLTKLHLESPLIRSQHLAAIGPQPKLTELVIRNSPKLFGIDLQQFPNLRTLTIRNCGLRSQGLRGFKNHKHLQKLSLTDCEHLRRVPLTGASALKVIDLSDTPVGDETAEQFNDMRSLQIITLRNCPNITTIPCTQLIDLRQLDVSGSGVAHLVNIGEADQLERLDLANLEFLNDLELHAIAGLPRLRKLDVTNTGFSAESRKTLEDLQSRGGVKVYLNDR